MTTKIKAVKCPNCGSEKHVMIDDKRFVCKNCNTEFYIDDDDININVNHHFDHGESPMFFTSTPYAKPVAGIVVGVLALCFFVFIPLLLKSNYSSMASKGEDSVEVHENHYY